MSAQAHITPRPRNVVLLLCVKGVLTLVYGVLLAREVSAQPADFAAWVSPYVFGALPAAAAELVSAYLIARRRVSGWVLGMAVIVLQMVVNLVLFAAYGVVPNVVILCLSLLILYLTGRHLIFHEGMREYVQRPRRND